MTVKGVSGEMWRQSHIYP